MASAKLRRKQLPTEGRTTEHEAGNAITRHRESGQEYAIRFDGQQPITEESGICAAMDYSSMRSQCGYVVNDGSWTSQLRLLRFMYPGDRTEVKCPTELAVFLSNEHLSVSFGLSCDHENTAGAYVIRGLKRGYSDEKMDLNTLAVQKTRTDIQNAIAGLRNDYRGQEALESLITTATCYMHYVRCFHKLMLQQWNSRSDEPTVDTDYWKHVEDMVPATEAMEWRCAFPSHMSGPAIAAQLQLIHMALGIPVSKIKYLYEIYSVANALRKDMKVGVVYILIELGGGNISANAYKKRPEEDRLDFVDHEESASVGFTSLVVDPLCKMIWDSVVQIAGRLEEEKYWLGCEGPITRLAEGYSGVEKSQFEVGGEKFVVDREVIEPIFERYTDQIMPYYEQQKAMIKKQSSRESIQTFVCGGPTHNKRVKQLLESRISAIRFLPERSLVVQGLLDWDGVPMKGVAATSLGFECQWPSKSSWHLGEQPPSTDIVAFPRLKGYADYERCSVITMLVDMVAYEYTDYEFHVFELDIPYDSKILTPFEPDSARGSSDAPKWQNILATAKLSDVRKIAKAEGTRIKVPLKSDRDPNHAHFAVKICCDLRPGITLFTAKYQILDMIHVTVGPPHSWLDAPNIEVEGPLFNQPTLQDVPETLFMHPPVIAEIDASSKFSGVSNRWIDALTDESTLQRLNADQNGENHLTLAVDGSLEDRNTHSTRTRKGTKRQAADTGEGTRAKRR